MQGRMSSASLVFPVAALAFGEPFDGGGDALLARRVLFRFGDPVEIFAALAGWEGFQRRFRSRRLVERGGKVGMHFGWRLGRVLGLAWRGRAFRKLRRSHDHLVEVGRQLIDAGELAELSHRAVPGVEAELLPSPEVDDRMRFERGGAEHDLAVDEVGRDAPLQPFLDFGHERVDALADMLEDRAREGLGLLDVGVDARIASHRMPCPSMRRMTPTTITNRLRLRPALLREIMPITAPMMASGTISQLSAP